jgi:hypothetical protein
LHQILKRLVAVVVIPAGQPSRHRRKPGEQLVAGGVVVVVAQRRTSVSVPARWRKVKPVGSSGNG